MHIAFQLRREANKRLRFCSDRSPLYRPTRSFPPFFLAPFVSFPSIFRPSARSFQARDLSADSNSFFTWLPRETKITRLPRRGCNGLQRLRRNIISPVRKRPCRNSNYRGALLFRRGYRARAPDGTLEFLELSSTPRRGAWPRVVRCKINTR